MTSSRLGKERLNKLRNKLNVLARAKANPRLLNFLDTGTIRDKAPIIAPAKKKQLAKKSNVDVSDIMREIRKNAQKVNSENHVEENPEEIVQSQLLVDAPRDQAYFAGKRVGNLPANELKIFIKEQLFGLNLEEDCQRLYEILEEKYDGIAQSQFLRILDINNFIIFSNHIVNLRYNNGKLYLDVVYYDFYFRDQNNPVENRQVPGILSVSFILDPADPNSSFTLDSIEPSNDVLSALCFEKSISLEQINRVKLQQDNIRELTLLLTALPKELNDAINTLLNFANTNEDKKRQQKFDSLLATLVQLINKPGNETLFCAYNSVEDELLKLSSVNFELVNCLSVLKSRLTEYRCSFYPDISMINEGSDQFPFLTTRIEEITKKFKEMSADPAAYDVSLSEIKEAAVQITELNSKVRDSKTPLIEVKCYAENVKKIGEKMAGHPKRDVVAGLILATAGLVLTAVSVAAIFATFGALTLPAGGSAALGVAVASMDFAAVMGTHSAIGFVGLASLITSGMCLFSGKKNLNHGARVEMNNFADAVVEEKKSRNR